MSGEPTPDLRRRAWPTGLVGMAGLVLLVELSVARHDRDLTTVWASAWKLSGEAARGEAARAPILCLGDSLVKQGVAPRVVEAIAGRGAYNLAVFNGQAPTAYFLLRRALEAGGRPEAVIVDGEVFEHDPREHIRMWGDLLDFRESVELARVARDAGFLGAVTMARGLPSCKARFEVRAGALAALRGESASSRTVLRLHHRNWDRNRGAHLVPGDPAAPERLGRAIAASGYLPTSWSCHPINAAFARKFLRLAEGRRIPVFWVLPPLHPEVQERRDRGGMHGDYVAFLRRLQAKYPNLTVVDGRHSGYPPDALADATHLNRDGSARFSADLAAVLRDRLGGEAGPRWIELSRSSTPPAEVPLEDLDQSRIALREARARRVR